MRGGDNELPVLLPKRDTAANHLLSLSALLQNDRNRVCGTQSKDCVGLGIGQIGGTRRPFWFRTHIGYSSRTNSGGILATPSTMTPDSLQMSLYARSPATLPTSTRRMTQSGSLNRFFLARRSHHQCADLLPRTPASVGVPSCSQT